MQFSPILKELCACAAEHYPKMLSAVAELAKATKAFRASQLKNPAKAAQLRSKQIALQKELDQIQAEMTELNNNIAAAMSLQEGAVVAVQHSQQVAVLKVKHVEYCELNGIRGVSIAGEALSDHTVRSFVIVEGTDSSFEVVSM